MLRDMRASTLAGEAGLLVSAVVDTLLSFARAGNLAPRTLWDVRLRLRRLDVDVTFSVRGGTDDVYSVLPRREGVVHDALLDRLRPGDVFVDGGANIGYYTVLAARRVGPSGQVIGIEPIPPTLGQLRRNVAENGASNVALHAVALGAAPGVLVLQVAGGMYGLGSPDSREGGQAFEVPVATLDSLCGGLPRIALVKLDVEGGELAALQGAEQVLARTAALVVECNKDAPAIHDLLSRHGFTVRPLSFATYVLAERKEDRA